MSHEDGRELRRIAWRQRVIACIAAVIKKYGRESPAAQGSPHLGAKTQATASNLENLRRGRRLPGDVSYQRESDHHATREPDNHRSFHGLLYSKNARPRLRGSGKRHSLPFDDDRQLRAVQRGFERLETS